MIKFIFLILLPTFSYAASTRPLQNFKVQLNMGLSNDTLDSKSTSGVTSSEKYNQMEFRPQGTYFLTDKWAVGAFYFQKSMIASFNSSGVGGFLRYYFTTNNTVTKHNIDNKKISQSPTISYFLQAGAKRETLEAESISYSFAGIEIAGGADWHFSEDYFLNATFNLGQQYSGTSKSLSTQSLLLGIGKAFSM